MTAAVVPSFAEPAIPAVVPSAGGAPAASLAALAGHDLLATPLWLFDPDAGQLRWANRAGLALWQEPDLDSLRRRPLAAREALGEDAADQLRRLAAGEAVEGLWSVALRGRRLQALCRFVPVRLEAGGRHVLAEAKAWHWAGASDEPASAPPARELAPGQLNLLLEEHSAVLELIAGGSGLEATLERVALAVARTVGARALRHPVARERRAHLPLCRRAGRARRRADALVQHARGSRRAAPVARRARSPTGSAPRSTRSAAGAVW